MTLYSEEQGKAINLSDYDHEWEIEVRQLIGELSSFEASVLEELLYSSLTVTLDELIESLEAEHESLLMALKRINTIDLFEMSGNTLIINKEKRKTLEPIGERVERDFSPTMEHLVAQLSNLPIGLLPRWYELPFTSEEIYQSIIDKYLITPKKYELHISFAKQKTPRLEKVCELLYSAPGCKLAVSKLKEELAITDKECHKLILELEFHFICCLNYENVNGKLEAFLLPPKEWLNYIENEKCLKKQETLTLKEQNSTPSYSETISKLLRAIIVEKANLREAEAIASHPLFSFEEIFATIQALQLAQIEDGCISILSEGINWLKMDEESQAMALYFSHLKRYHRAAMHKTDPCPFSDRDVREVERALSRLHKNEWFELETFTNSIASAIGSAKPVTLERRGKRWHYALPEYSDHEKQFIRNVICDHLVKCGMVVTATSPEGIFFRVTPFGRKAIG